MVTGGLLLGNFRTSCNVERCALTFKIPAFSDGYDVILRNPSRVTNMEIINLCPLPLPKPPAKSES